MTAVLMMLRPIRYGWSVQLSDGRELARFLGPAAKWRAMRFLRRAAEAATLGSIAPLISARSK